MNATVPDRLVVAGVDVGSSAIKVVLLEDRLGDAPRVLIGRRERVRRRNTKDVTAGLFATCLAELGLERADLAYVATTGEGEIVDFRTGHFYGMTTHARGGSYLDPEATAIIDIGALHARRAARLLGHDLESPSSVTRCGWR